MMKAPTLFSQRMRARPDALNTLANELVNARCARYRTVLQLAKDIGINPNTLMRWEYGNTAPGIQHLEMLFKVFKPDELPSFAALLAFRKQQAMPKRVPKLKLKTPTAGQRTWPAPTTCQIKLPRSMK